MASEFHSVSPANEHDAQASSRDVMDARRIRLWEHLKALTATGRLSPPVRLYWLDSALHCELDLTSDEPWTAKVGADLTAQLTADLRVTLDRSMQPVENYRPRPTVFNQFDAIRKDPAALHSLATLAQGLFGPILGPRRTTHQYNSFDKFTFDATSSLLAELPDAPRTGAGRVTINAAAEALARRQTSSGSEAHLESRVRQELADIHARLVGQEDYLPAERLDAARARFGQMFGPEALRQLDGEALLERMHGTGSKNSLAYWLEFKDDEEFPTRAFGSMFGGSAAKFGLYRQRETGSWVAGAGKRLRVLSLAEAVTRARQHRDQILQGAQAIQAFAERTDDAAYLELQRELDRVAPDLADTAWGHKYFSLLFPDALDAFHVRKLQDWNLLCLLQRPPEADGRFVCAGRFVTLAGSFGWTQLDLMHTLYARNGSPSMHFLVDEAQLGPGGLQALLAQSIIGFAGVEAGDLRSRDDDKHWKPDLRAKVTLAYPALEGRDLDRKTTELGWFIYETDLGSHVVVTRGKEALAVGVTTGEYRFVPDSPLPHQRAVRWVWVGSFELPSAECAGGTYDEMKVPDNIIAVRRALLEPSPPPVIAPEPVPMPRPVRPTSTPPPVVPRRRPVPPFRGVPGQIQSILERKGQAILYGPPGTGKTYWAERTACDLAAWEEHGRPFDELDEPAREAIRGPNGRVRLCTFHPAYGYEDFIEGYRPQPKATGMTFERRDGVFKRLCADASAPPPSERLTYLLIIDEVNRGDVPRIFGELLTLLEIDKRGRIAHLPSGEAFSIPANVRVIGTMNTADRSIALLDAALRRRFGFVELMPDFKALGDMVIKPALPLGAWLQRLNRRILQHVERDARNLQIGHAYFLDRGRPVDSTARFVQILREDVLPLLEEYCYADFRTLALLIGEKIVDAENQRIRDELFAPERAAEVVELLLALDQDLTTDPPPPPVGSDDSGRWRAAEPGDLSNEDLMKRLVFDGASDADIREAFRKRYAERGKTDEAWVAERVAIYRQIAERDRTATRPPVTSPPPPPQAPRGGPGTSTDGSRRVAEGGRS